MEDKHQPTMAKMGAMLGLGILNAGGRNVTIGLTSNAGFRKMASIVGVMLSLQYWYWYPLMHFMSLSFTPTSMIGLDGEMRMPVDFSATCHKKASMFAYVVFVSFLIHLVRGLTRVTYTTTNINRAFSLFLGYARDRHDTPIQVLETSRGEER